MEDLQASTHACLGALAFTQFLSTTAVLRHSQNLRAIRCRRLSARVLGVLSRHSLGGEDFDNRIVDYCLQDFKRY